VVDRLEAREGAKGRVSAHGEVAFHGLLPDDVWADVVAHRVLIASVPYLRAIGSSDDLKIRLVRPSPEAPRAPHITGTVRVDKAIYTGEFTTTGPSTGGPFAPSLTPAWTADVSVHASEQVRISNQSAELRVEGDVDVIRDTAGLRFRGTGEIPRGRVPLFNNDFSIVSGSLDFSRRPLEPEVDITADTEVPIYDPGDAGGRQLERITVHLTGTFAEPKVQFQSENGLDESSILQLLAGFGGPGGSTTVSTGVSDMGLRAGLNFLERALAQRVGGVDTIDIETEESGVSQMQSTRIAVGKYLSENLYLRLAQGLSITERDLFLEYQVSRRFLFTSELRRRLRENGAENQFNVDLKYRVKY
jgi:autotransporter translocation and assembly factor TamB